MEFNFENFAETLSDVAEGAKDVAKDVAEGTKNVVVDAGEMAQETLDTMGDDVVEALENNNYEKAIECSDMPDEIKGDMKEASKAFALKEVKGLGRLAVGVLEAGAAIASGDITMGIRGFAKTVRGGVDTWNSLKQISEKSNNAQLQTLAGRA